jgi:hypothetical protein
MGGKGPELWEHVEGETDEDDELRRRVMSLGTADSSFDSGIPLGPPTAIAVAPLPVPPSTMQTLVMSFMVTPFPLMQSAFPELSSYSVHQLAAIWRTALTSPPQVTLTPSDPPFAVPVEPTEDFAIVTFLQWHPDPPLDICAFYREFGDLILPFRATPAVLQRFDHWAAAPDDARDAILDKFARLLAMEFCYDLSTRDYVSDVPLLPGDLVACRSDAIFDPQSLPGVDESLDDLLVVSQELFEYDPSPLAVFRTEVDMFAMKCRRIVVGQGDACDLNLCRGVGERVVGVSRHQAVVSFQPDLQFYIDNVGSVDLVVNGARLRPGQFGRLPNGAVIDFAGNLLLFIQNTQLIKRIARCDDEMGDSRGDQGGQKEKPRDVIRLRTRIPKQKTKKCGAD